MTQGQTRNEEEFYERVKEASAFPLWKMHGQTPEPRPQIVPHVWRWDLISGLANEAGSMDNVLNAGGERRALIMVNPSFLGQRLGTTPTISAAIQMIKPGEAAPAHRHSIVAIRFILRGNGATTIVNGEKVVMEEGDLVLTPQMSWHDHENSMDENIYWLDGLDAPLVNFLNAQFFQNYYEDVQPVTSPRNYTLDRLGRGMLRNAYAPPKERALSLIYKWRDAHAALLNVEDDDVSPFDGVIFEYTNPLDAGHTLPSMSCFIQRLRPGEHTRAHRHTTSTVYHAFRGKGFSVINGQKLEWSEGDTFALPSWAWHEHANASRNEDAFLFSMSDLPIIETADLWKVEEGQRQEEMGATG